MSSNYTVVSGDTLSKIAVKHYGNAALTRALGAFNGLLDVNLIQVGQVLELPAVDELSDTPPPAPQSPAVSVVTSIKPPHGLQAIIDVFGDPMPFKNNKSAWAQQILGKAKLPAPLPQSWDGVKVSTFSCHKKLTGLFTDVFQAIHDRGHWNKLRTFDGCYNYRLKRTSGAPSTHTWAIAVDVNAATNQLGTRGDLDPAIVAVFREFGFKWGGDFKDPMHFQFCTGY